MAESNCVLLNASDGDQVTSEIENFNGDSNSNSDNQGMYFATMGSLSTGLWFIAILNLLVQPAGEPRLLGGIVTIGVDREPHTRTDMELGTSSSAVNDLDWRTVPYRFQEEAQRRTRQLSALKSERDDFKSRYKQLSRRYNILSSRFEDIKAENHVLEKKLANALRVPTVKSPNEDRNATSSSQVSQEDIR